MLFIPGPMDANQELQESTTKAADFSGTWLDLGEGYAPGGLGLPAAAVIDVTARDFTTTDETYSFTLEETDPDANGDPDATKIRAIGVAAAVTDTGLALAKGLITGRFVRLSLDVGGTSPSITYSSYLGV